MKSRGAVYLRISKDREGRELGVRRQREDTLALAGRLGVEVVGIYQDNDISASTLSRKPRPDYNRMFTDARKGMFDVILAYTSGRLTRRPRENEDLIDLAINHGISYQYVKSPSFDLNTSAGRRVARMLAANDAGEAEDISERGGRTKLQAAQSGAYRGGPRPLGYEQDGVTIRPAEADTLLEAAYKVLAGVSLNAAAKGASEKGIRRTGTRRCRHCGGTKHQCADLGEHEFEPKPPLPLDGKSLMRILTRPRNAGYMEYQAEVMLDPDTGAPVRGEWPPIIPEPVWHALRTMNADPSRRTSPPPGRRYLGSGIYLCGLCDDGTTVKAAPQGGKRRNDPAYSCRSGRHLSRAQDVVDEIVEAAVVERLRRGDLADLLQDDDRPDIEALSREALAIRERIAEAGDMWESGEITRAERRIRVDRLNTQLDQIESRMASAVRNPLLVQLAAAEDVEAAYDGLDLMEKRAVVPLLVRVKLMPAKRGRPPGWRPGEPYFDPASVVIERP